MVDWVFEFSFDYYPIDEVIYSQHLVIVCLEEEKEKKKNKKKQIPKINENK
jgi:hypothetical protein